MKAAGVPKKFSPEEIERRILNLAKARKVQCAKRQARKRQREEMKRLVESAASIGVFVPVQDFE